MYIYIYYRFIVRCPIGSNPYIYPYLFVYFICSVQQPTANPNQVQISQIVQQCVPTSLQISADGTGKQVYVAAQPTNVIIAPKTPETLSVNERILELAQVSGDQRMVEQQLPTLSPSLTQHTSLQQQSCLQQQTNLHAQQPALQSQQTSLQTQPPVLQSQQTNLQIHQPALQTKQLSLQTQQPVIQSQQPVALQPITQQLTQLQIAQILNSGQQLVQVVRPSDDQVVGRQVIVQPTTQQPVEQQIIQQHVAQSQQQVIQTQHIARAIEEQQVVQQSMELVVQQVSQPTQQQQMQPMQQTQPVQQQFILQPLQQQLMAQVLQQIVNRPMEQKVPPIQAMVPSLQGGLPLQQSGIHSGVSSLQQTDQLMDQTVECTRMIQQAMPQSMAQEPVQTMEHVHQPMEQGGHPMEQIQSPPVTQSPVLVPSPEQSVHTDTSIQLVQNQPSTNTTSANTPDIKQMQYETTEPSQMILSADKKNEVMAYFTHKFN